MLEGLGKLSGILDVNGEGCMLSDTADVVWSSFWGRAEGLVGKLVFGANLPLICGCLSFLLMQVGGYQITTGGYHELCKGVYKFSRLHLGWAPDVRMLDAYMSSSEVSCLVSKTVLGKRDGE